MICRTFRILFVFLVGMLAACNMDSTGLELTSGWHAHSVVVWKNIRPDMLALSPDGKWLYISCETNASILAPSLVAIDLETGGPRILISGLMRADGLKFAPDGSLWIGEEFPQGLIWRIADVGRLPVRQTVDRARMVSSHPAIAPFRAAGRFAHEGITFSQDKRFAYLADEAVRGSLYRLTLNTRHMDVLSADKGWVAISPALDIRNQAEHLQARTFNRIEDMETLPDGRILMAETGTGSILVLNDADNDPEIEEYLHDSRIAHPDNLAWDAVRKWLWITDDSSPSSLWAWDGQKLIHIATHRHAEITGVLAVNNTIYLNLQGRSDGPELTLRLNEVPTENE
jgi:sugar lactone lactonase YvrE